MSFPTILEVLPNGTAIVSTEGMYRVNAGGEILDEFVTESRLAGLIELHNEIFPEEPATAVSYAEMRCVDFCDG